MKRSTPAMMGLLAGALFCSTAMAGTLAEAEKLFKSGKYKDASKNVGRDTGGGDG